MSPRAVRYHFAPFIFTLALALAPPARAATVTLTHAEDPMARSCGATAPAGWQQPAFDDAAWQHHPDASGCDVLRIRRRFDVADPAHLASLTLTARYQDGLVAWINGVEVARRHFDDGARVAREPHGSEPELLAIPVTRGLLHPGSNLLAFEVHPFRAGRLATADALLAGSDGVRIARGPYLTRVLDGEAHLAVETDLPTRADVLWRSTGPTPIERRTGDTALATRHLLRLAPLDPGAAYHYRVTLSAADPALAPATYETDFHTPPTATHPLRFVLTGDMRSGHDVHAQIVKSILAYDPDLVLMTGDLVAIGSDEAEWQTFFEIEQPLIDHVPIYSALGNHDMWRGSDGLRRFQTLFDREGTPAWWSFDVSGVHFVLLDSEDYRDPAQLAWLKADLAAAPTKNWRAIFACAHHGPWSAGVHGDDPDAIRDYVPLLEAAHATALVYGHDHHYERGKVGNLSYIVSGGGGAELRGARCGVPGKKRCDPRVTAFINEHHYIEAEVRADSVRLCPRRPDGTPLEPCFTLPARP